MTFMAPGISSSATMCFVVVIEVSQQYCNPTNQLLALNKWSWPPQNDLLHEHRNVCVHCKTVLHYTKYASICILQHSCRQVVLLADCDLQTGRSCCRYVTSSVPTTKSRLCCWYNNNLLFWSWFCVTYLEHNLILHNASFFFFITSQCKRDSSVSQTCWHSYLPISLKTKLEA